MKIIIVGAGKVGMELTRQLSADHKVTVIDRDPQIINNLVNIYDVMAVCGNGGSYEVQKEAEVDKAELLIAATSTDELNIMACLVAKKMGVKHTIARVRNPEYESQLRFMREELGLSMAINPEKAAAREIARVLRFPAAMKMESFSKGRLELVEYRLPEDSKLHEMRLADLYRSLRIRVLICAVSRREETIIPSGDFVLQAGDKIYLTSSPNRLAQFFQYLFSRSYAHIGADHDFFQFLQQFFVYLPEVLNDFIYLSEHRTFGFCESGFEFIKKSHVCNAFRPIKCSSFFSLFQ